ncbi:predicted protein [Coccidioides posadasii str. Silveira]|uniref:Predicted protein n=1 Tax=Coccidioides posadasii (strain RMSCC 757 / Silveira) TaxID=443226 RepID=E9CYL0_COCPS|nr:predicted protein [Coccidioides posadasii str. Silveira]
MSLTISQKSQEVVYSCCGLMNGFYTSSWPITLAFSDKKPNSSSSRFLLFTIRSGMVLVIVVVAAGRCFFGGIPQTWTSQLFVTSPMTAA